MNFLLLKLILAPSFVALASLAGRRWGLKISGLVGTLPIVAGPILFFFALEQGTAFAAPAAQETLLGLVGFSAFAVVYGWTSRWWNIPVSVLISWSAFLLPNFFICRLDWPLWVSLAVGLASLNLARFLLPETKKTKSAAKSEKSVWDLPLRMTATALLVWGLTSLAQRLGPELSGVLTVFPIASTVLTGFAHYHHGGEGVARLLRGVLMGMQAAALFCASLSLTLIPWGIGWAFGVSLFICALGQLVVLKLSGPVERVARAR
ncbi:MAG TPA: hypothetical protein VK791_00690 [bacterium]|nr:hypothetical protein [bacterium]